MSSVISTAAGNVNREDAIKLEPSQADPKKKGSGAKVGSSVQDDFSRDVWCLFGLPVDNLSIDSACRLLERRIKDGKKNVLSTINVNWVVSSLTNADFRAAILDSDICTIDGVPLIRLSRYLGLPMREAVQGSTLTSCLLNRHDSSTPLSIFLFGGDCGIAALAHEEINRKLGGLRAVGYYNPGFGILSELNSNEGLAVINRSSPNILLVALGALKGQLWIEQHKTTIKANIISHLGTTINFLAGIEKRAPRWMQTWGVEWLWRIAQKPSLWRRYALDGAIFIRLVTIKWLPYLLFLRRQARIQGQTSSCCVTKQEDSRGITLVLAGTFTYRDKDYVRKHFRYVAAEKKDITLDLKEVTFLDNSFLGFLLVLLKHQRQNGRNVSVRNLSEPIEKVFKYNLIDKSFEALQYSIYR